MSLLFTKQKRDRLEAEARARGEVVDYLAHEAPQEFRWQLWYALSKIGTDVHDVHGRSVERLVQHGIHEYLREEYGWPRLGTSGSDFAEDLKSFVLQDATTEQLMDVINAVPLGALRGFRQTGKHPKPTLEKFFQTIRSRMAEHKLAYDIVEMHVVEKDSNELHDAAVAPALTLLHGRTRFLDAEKQYRDALDEIAQRNFADAVTDANATVEIVLRQILGMEQGQLPDLLAHAKERGLFGDPQTARIKKVVDGFAVLADIRNQESDAHGKSADRETAWLAVHWAGALVVFLVERAEALGL